MNNKTVITELTENETKELYQLTEVIELVQRVDNQEFIYGIKNGKPIRPTYSQNADIDQLGLLKVA